MPGWLRKIGQGPSEQGWYRQAKLLTLIAKADADCCTTTTTTTTEPPPAGPLRMTFIGEGTPATPVADPADVTQWNTFFDLPANGTPFTSVIVGVVFIPDYGYEVQLWGGAGITTKDSLFDTDNAGVYLTSIIDDAECIVATGYDSFGDDQDGGCYRLLTVSLPALVTAGTQSFYNALLVTSFNLPAMTTAMTYSFSGCSAVTSFSFPALVTAGVNVFRGCIGVTSFNLPSLTSEVGGSFSLLPSIVSFSLPALVTAGVGCFLGCPLATSFSLPALITIGFECFKSCTSATTFYLPLCTDLGGTVGDNNVFNNILGNTITLTIPASRMTCDAGSPDGDIVYLQANNTVTVIQT